MWRKSIELPRLKALRRVALEAMQGEPAVKVRIRLTVEIHAEPGKGDLDNFITGICDGLQAAHPCTPIQDEDWVDLPEGARPRRNICFEDDSQMDWIQVQRLPVTSQEEFYTVRFETF